MKQIGGARYFDRHLSRSIKYGRLLCDAHNSLVTHQNYLRNMRRTRSLFNSTICELRMIPHIHHNLGDLRLHHTHTHHTFAPLTQSHK